MDKQTIEFYEREALNLAADYDSCDGGIAEYFHTAFSAGMRILEVGCGTGRDLARLLEMGFDAEGVEPCKAFREHAIEKHPSLRNRISSDQLPELITIDSDAYDAVLCSGVLMHLPEEHVFDAVYTIRRVLKADGRLLISVPREDGLPEGKVRDAGDRLFNRIPPDKWQLIFERLGFTMISRWNNHDGLKRKTRTWTTLLFTLAHSDKGRPLDKIEAILNRDTKVATYKLALFRALAELAQTSYNLARWRIDGKVLIPLEAVAEKWITYFWPIVAHTEVRIPQTTGRPIAFRSLLSDLIELYSSKQGGLAGFSIDFRSRQLPGRADRVYRKLMSKLKSTIWNQPVRYAGGGAHFSVFQYERQDKCLAMDADMWRELSLTGSWIQDATILRWAELTSRISNGEVKPSTVVDLLLTTPLPDRDANAAKQIYDRLDGKECVWTEKRIVADYDVDHAIPFSLWHNNDLWNLLPVNRQANSRKRDKLPSRKLVRCRRDAIIYYWEVMQERFPVRFDYEMAYLCGTGTEGPAGWQSRLFRAFGEAVEVTACRRGTERWEPQNMVALLPPSVQKSAESEMEATPPVLVDYAVAAEQAYTRFLPVIGDVAAGVPFHGIGVEDRDHFDRSEYQWAECPESFVNSRSYVLRATGDSMEPTISKGDLVICEYHRHAQRGRDIVVMADVTFIEGGECAVKRLRETSNAWIFTSDNTTYQDITIPKEQGRDQYPILGVVVYNLTTRRKLM